MRIAYLANYQDAEVVRQRGMRRNLALAGSWKIRTIAELLSELGHEVVLFSRGAVAENSLRWFGEVRSTLPDTRPTVEVLSGPRWDCSYPGALLGIWSLQQMVAREHRRKPFDLVISYNVSHTESAAALWAAKVAGLPLVLEYEDDATIPRLGSFSLLTFSRARLVRYLRPHLKGLIAVSPELDEQIGLENSFVLPGIVAADLCRARAPSKPSARLKVFFAGTLEQSKGVEVLLRAWGRGLQGAELHLVGDGPQRQELEQRYGQPSVVFHGYVERTAYVKLLVGSDLCVNPHLASLKAGNVFPFKLVEYVGAGKPVVSTPLGQTDPTVASAIVFSDDHSPEGLRAALQQAIAALPAHSERARRSRRAVIASYGREAVKRKLAGLLDRAVAPCSRRRVLFIHHGQAWGGASKCLRDLMASLRDDHELVLWTPGRALEERFAAAGACVRAEPGIATFQVGVGWYRLTDVHRWAPLLLRVPRAVLAARRVVRELQPDLVHINSSSLAPVAIGAKLAGARIVWHVREPMLRGYFGLRRAAVRRIMHWCADCILAISEYDRSLLGEINQSKAAVVYDWIDEPELRPRLARAEVRASLGVPHDAPLVVFLGGTNRIKGLEVLLEASGLVLRARPDVRFVVAGCEEQRPTAGVRSLLLRLAPSLSSSLDLAQLRRQYSAVWDAVKVLGVVDDTTSLLGAADLAVFPALVTHFARPVVEANALGKPAIASNFGEAREIIEDGVTGYLVQPGAAGELAARILALVEDVALRQQMGSIAQQRVLERFARARNEAVVRESYARVR